MIKKEKAIERLAFIKYLYDFGVEQSRKAEPFCWASILTFQDAIELFLALASEYLDLEKRIRDIQFMKYWPLLSKKLTEIGKGELTQSISMEKLNKARVDFKHYGNPPSKTVIEDARLGTLNFFEENTITVFDIPFSEISLIELIHCQSTKTGLKQAKEMLYEERIEDALGKVALAFAQLIDDYENRKKDKYGRSPFFFGKEMTFLGSFFMNIPHTSRLADFIDAVKESVEAMQDSVRILSLGLDYRKYARFRLLTPVIRKIPSSPRKIKYEIQRIERGSEAPPTAEDVEFCINFVIESALILQEFDFSLEHTPAEYFKV